MFRNYLFRSCYIMGIKKLLHFLNKLEENEIFYKLDKMRSDAIMVEIAVPGQRWEVEFMDDDTIEVEKFISDGEYYDGKEIETLLRDFAN